MKGLFRSRLVPGTGVALLALLLLASTTQAVAPIAAEPKEKTKLPAVLDKAAPASVEELKAIQDHVKSVLKKVVPATVGIRVGGASGSGVIINAEGYVLTAGHVSGKPNRDCFIILPDGKQVKARTLGQNVPIDTGLIKITEKGKWNYVEMGDSSKLKNGQWCLAVGHPGGFKPGRSPVVRLGRVLLSRDAVIQSDCTLVGGDSGGPLFDMEGKVIGIHSRIGPSITANIHVPVNNYRDTWDRLAKGESWGGRGSRRTSRAGTPYLGVGFSLENNNLEITDVYENTPAEKAGLKVGDVIVSIDSRKISKRSELADALQKKKVGDEVALEVHRDKKPVNVKLKLGKRPADD
jgi:serine protease Do